MSEENKNNAPASDNGVDDNTAQAPADPAPDRGEHLIPKSRFDQVVGQRKAAETALQEVVDDLVQEVPEDRRDLIPDLPPAEKIKWIRRATKAGVFGNRGATSGPDSRGRAASRPLTLTK